MWITSPIIPIDYFIALAHNLVPGGTKKMHIGHNLKIEYEQLPGELEMINDTLDRLWLRQVRSLVLKLNKLGLLPLLQLKSRQSQ